MWAVPGTPFAVAALRLVRQNISTDSISLPPMAEPTQSTETPANSAAGHLSVHFEGQHPVAVPFLFEQRDSRLGPAFVASLLYHVGVFALMFFVVRYGGPTTTAAFLPDQPNS